MMEKQNQIVITKKKQDLYASNVYQYHKLEEENYGFVPCQVLEAQDELEITFFTEDLMPISGVRDMELSIKYGVLLQVLEICAEHPQYYFAVSPENLYLDMQNRVRVLERDFLDSGQFGEERLAEILALAGCLLQKKYSYEDYYKGGLKLLTRQRRTRFLSELTSLQDAMEVFRSHQKEAREQEQQNLILVRRNTYRCRTGLLAITALGCAVMAALLVYQKVWQTEPMASALEAERYYMENNLTAVADALASIPVSEMDRHEKYILAVTYIRGQSIDSFDYGTKERLISKLSWQGDENLLDYWIYLGRLEIDQALDVAMRISDNQLTLYAYLQKLEQVSMDTQLPGEEKAQQMETLRSRIKSLADELGVSYKESQTGGE